MKKNYFRYLIIIATIVVLYFVFNIFQKSTSTGLAVYKEGYVSDCYNDKKKPDDKIVFKTKDFSSKDDLLLGKASNENVELDKYQPSSCVENTARVYNNYFKVTDYTIDHKKGVNDRTYQLSYQEVLEQLKSRKNKSDLDKRVISAIEYKTTNPSAVQFIPDVDDKMQRDSQMIGPDQNANSGKYVMFIKLNFIEQRIYKLENNKKVVDSNNLVFDGVSTEYVAESK